MTIDEFLEINNIRVRPEPRLPASVKACCYHDDDGNEYVLFHPSLSKTQALRALEHELLHIVRGEMYEPEYREYDDAVAMMDVELLKRLARAWTLAIADQKRLDERFVRSF